jgi:hypothetical protein
LLSSWTILKKRHAGEDYSAIFVRATPSHVYMGIDRPFVAPEAAGIGAEWKIAEGWHLARCRRAGAAQGITAHCKDYAGLTDRLIYSLPKSTLGSRYPPSVIPSYPGPGYGQRRRGQNAGETPD